MSTIHRHNGGDCPVPGDTEVVVRYRNGEVSPVIRADQRRWRSWPDGPSDWDIARWRYAVEPAAIIAERVAA